MFKTEDELLRHFEDGGCMLDTVSGDVYISDVNLDGEFFGIFVTGPIPSEDMGTIDDAVQAAYYYPMEEYCAPGCWFSELAERVIANPSMFLA